MKRDLITIGAENFKYPTREEILLIREEFPTISKFNFKYVSPLTSILDKQNTLIETTRLNNLYWWDYCLNNKIWKLYETFIFTLTNYNRGLPEEINECKKEEVANHLLFDYYAEIYYYYYFSIAEIIAQIINVYYFMNIKEEKVQLNEEFLSKIKCNKVKEYSSIFIEATKKAKKIRNSSVHRFSPFENDYRCTIKKEKDIISMGVGSGFRIQPFEIIINIKDSLSHLSSFMLELKGFIK